ncbi:hypothetical protein B0A78_11910 [Flavobacterium columnare NBRC 100251 = ATCC 23463]|uniref:Uncharacterized protein n=2 Tax=Flavobacterium columnare TaxID=996 RepID=G8X4T8_FLACA|nr:hypothetical protein FCOL_06575 [Flavobacterium columnare ATCC 49512]ANO48657.1 hypothetical protein Pf1_00409 [Flavobacterium columnare]PDS22436.1 hypothetical protein B0A78_11910 [Flavobacterium columnare NBRC 100251 = ATCC 23463]APT23306.1 hypothetical protein BU993_12160 [Flavobacterium columnare]MBF6651963.1 hypothetical protein [Flavobacterium columnare]
MILNVSGMKKRVLLIFVILSSIIINGQVGIGTVTPQGILDISSNTSGLVPPRVQLTASNSEAPVLNPQGGSIAEGTIVYNTVTAGIAPNDVVSGFYYWNGTKWLLLTNQSTTTPTNWSILGNGNTNPNTNFIGTTNANDFVTRTNNIERLRVTSTGNLGIGTSSPTSTLDVNGSLRIRNIPVTTSSTQILTSDANGNIGTFNTHLLSDVDGIVALNPVSYSIASPGIVNNLNLGLSTSVSLPANKNCIIIINYSVPVGISNFPKEEVIGYYGIRFLKNGTEAEAGSRKSTIVNNYEAPPSTGSTANMSTITNTYIEKFTTGASPVNITYSLNGYIEYYSYFNSNFLFNMWSSSPPNYNWGRATITKQVYIL